MVRLKETGKTALPVKLLFQFLMVRLKDLWRAHIIFKFTFQFLMVRLKVRMQVQKIFPKCISIPYGAIKRQNEKLY